MSKIIGALFLAASAVSANGAKPLFDYTFGAEWPFCTEFGSTLKQLYAADGIADAVDFAVHADIRPQGAGWHCPDEESTCPTTQWVLCAMDSQPIDVQISFLTCFDAAKEGTPAQEKTKTCAATAKLDFAKITKCHDSQDIVGLLMKTEGEYIVKRYPQLVPVPHIEIDHVAADPEKRDYATLLKALCSKGIKAGACHKTTVVV